MKAKNLLTPALCVALALLCLAGCSHDTPPEESGTVATADTTASAVVTRPADEDDIPFETDFHGEEITLLCRAEKAGLEWGLSELGGQGTLQRAVFERKEKVENRLNATIRTVTAPGDWSDRKAFLSAVMADADTPDLVLQNSAVVGTGAIQGCYRDLTGTEYLNLNKPWWPGEQARACAVCGKIYGILGDASVTLTEETQCILENADLVASLQLDKPETAVSSGAWTMEALLRLLQEANLPGNPDGTTALKATFAANTAYDAMIYGAGYTLADSKDGSIVLSADLDTPAFAAWFDAWSAFSRRQDMQTLPPSGTDGFASGNVLFHFGTLADIRRYLSNTKTKTVILPYPKQTESQKDYCTVCTADATAFSIPTNTKNAALAGAVLEASASYGYQVVSPAYLGNITNNPYMDGAVNKENFALLHRCLTFDPARLYAEHSYCANVFRQLNVTTDSWEFVYRNNRALWESGLQKIREGLS